MECFSLSLIARRSVQLCMAFAAPSSALPSPDNRLLPPVSSKRLSPTARRLAAVYARYACFGHSEPIFRSKEFAKLIKEAGLETASFNTRPPNRVDHVYVRASQRAHAS